MRRHTLVDLAALLLPLYVAFQLLPLPLDVVALLSPARAEIAMALERVGPAPTYATVTIAAPTTWVFFWRTLGYLTIFLIVRDLARGSTRWWTAALPLIVLGLCEAALVMAQYAAGATTRPGSYFSKDHVAGLLGMVLPLTSAYALAVLHRSREAGHLTGRDALTAGSMLAASAAIFAAISFSLSRAGLASALGALLVMGALASAGGQRPRSRWPVLTGLVLAVVLVVIFVIPADLVQHLGRLVSGEDAEGRVAIWQATLRLIGAFPIVGVGLGNFYPAVLRHQTSDFHVAWIAAHNDYLQQIAELGLVGAVLPAVVIGGAFVYAVRAALAQRGGEARWFALGCAGSLSAILVHSLFDFNTYVLANAMVLAWVAGLAVSTRGPGAAASHGHLTALDRAPVLLTGGLLTAGAVVWLVFLTGYHREPATERAFCRVGFCDTEAVLTTLRGPEPDAAPLAVPLEHRLAFLYRDPAMPARWEQLADALQRAGQPSHAESALERAMMLDRSPQTLLNGAAFSFQHGQRQRGLALMRRGLMRATPRDLQFAIANALHHEVPVDEVLRYGLPDASTARAYLRALVAENRQVEAGIAWTWLLSSGALDQRAANEYVELLLRQRQPRSAADAWADFVRGRAAGYPDGTRVFNGDFEEEPSGSRFDWRLDERAGVVTTLDAAVARSGTRALRVQFDGTQNVTDVGVEQWIFLPTGRYRFSAYVKAEAISTDRGVAFQLVYDQAPSPPVTTEAVRGTHDWQLLEQIVEAPAEGGLARVRLVRQPSLKFDNLVRGTAWIDQVRLTPLPPDR